MKKILFSIIYTLLAFFTFSLNTKAISKEYTFSYTGDYQEFIAPFTGLYKLEVWGAEGGFGNSSSPGGKGGYSSGYYKLTVGDKIYIYVGGKGTTGVDPNGGYNGGGAAQTGTAGKHAGSGGGATDIRLINGLWNNSDSLKSRIIVAGGGGGGGWFHNTNAGNYSGGAGGGLSGANGETVYSSNPVGTGASQTKPGTSTQGGITTGGLGYGGTGLRASSSAGGGGGGYYGGGGSYCAGGGGGSGYIGGVTNFEDVLPITLDGTKDIPTYDNTDTMKGNSGNGFAKISLDLQIMFEADNLEFTTDFSDMNYFYVTIPSETYITNLSVKNFSYIWSSGLEEITLKNNTLHEVVLMDNVGNIHVFKIMPNLGKAKLKNVTYDGFDIEFNPNIFNYSLDVSNSVKVFNPIVETEDGVSFRIENNNLKVGKNIVSIEAFKDGIESTTYYFEVYRDLETSSSSLSTTFTYTGDYQEFIAPYTGLYKLELWGAEGATTYNSSLGGKGGYSKGYYYLKKDEKVYVYVGAKGRLVTSSSDNTGVFNGGGAGKVGSGGTYAGTGGGATDIRLINGNWNNVESLNSRIIVAGGGGGAGSSYSNTNSSDIGGGVGGGISGVGGRTIWGSSYLSYPGTQTAGGGGANSGSLGTGGGGAAETSSGGGGGGGYYGGGGASCGGGAGGSGYIGKVSNCGEDIAVTIAGDKQVPTYDGTGTMTGNSGDGYVKISYFNPDDLDIVKTIEVDKGTLSPSFNPLEYDYDLTLSADENILTISGETVKGEGLLMGIGTYEVKAGQTTYEISFTNIDGSITIYNINVTRLASPSTKLKGFKVNGKLYEIEGNVTTYDIEVPTEVSKINLELIKLYPGQSVPTNTIYDFTAEDLSETIIVFAEENIANEVYTFNFHRKRTSQLKSLNIKKGGTLKETFNSSLTNYTVQMSKGERTLDIDARAWFNDAKITMTEPRYIGENDKSVIITVDLDGVPSTTYTLNIERTDDVNINESTDFMYTGDYQEWIAPYTGTYLLEAWGAEGGKASDSSLGGKGGYSSGYYYFEGGDKVYIYVGGIGKTGSSGTISGGYNGGGIGKVGSGGRAIGSGGGATDIRLIKGIWNNLDSLKSRIIVAGGGGGAGMYFNGGNSYGGYGGGLSGGNGSAGPLSSGYVGTSGTQTAAGIGPQKLNYGGLGYGGQATNDVSSGGGGGGGYYGGGGGYCAGGGGGSSYINGLLSCNGDNPKTIAGNANMPTYDGNNTMLGNSGNGHAKITAKEVIMGDTFLDNIILNDGNIKIDFEPWTLEYNISIPKGEVELKIEAIAKDAKATITGIGITEFAPGTTKHEIIVSNEGATKKYILNVTREPLSDATPKNIVLKTSHDYLCSVTNGICDYTFKENITNYNVIVPFQTENITLKTTLKSKWQKVIYRKVIGSNKEEVVDSTFELTSGINTFEVEIISEDEKASTVYTYNISRDDNGNNSLTKLEVTNPLGIDINFSPYVYEYTITVPYTNDSITLNYETANPNSLVNVYNDKNLKVGMNDCLVTVTAPNNTSRTYIIHVFREQSSNTFLSSLEVLNSDNNNILELTPSFNKTILDYTIKVDSSVNNIIINATAEEGTLMGNGTYTLNSGKNHFEIVVTSVAGDIETYNIDVFKDRNNNSNLLNIEVEGYNLDKSFDKDIKEYTVTIPKDVTSLKVNVTPESDKATYTIRGNNNLNNNTNTIVITSIAEDKSYQVYTITVNKEISDNNYLSSIEVTGANLNEEFNKENLNYTINVDGSVDKIVINGILEDSTATITGNGIYALIKGENTINLVVTSELGNIRTYTITVNKSLNNDVTLKEVKNNHFSEVIKNEDETKNYDYLINVQYEVNSIDIEGIASALTSKVIGNGTYSLKTGNNDIILRVTAEDKITVKDYIVRVVRDKSDNDDLSFLYVHEGGIKPDFYETIIYYEVKVPNNTNTLHIEAIPEDKNANVDITSATLNNNIFEVDISSLNTNTPMDIDVVVTAENGNIKIYTISVVKQEASTENLALLKLETNRGELTPIFNSDVNNYELEVENNITDITITGEAMDKTNVDVVGLGTKNLKVGKNLIEVFVISKETNIEKSYQIVVTRKASNDASLASLVVKGHVLSPSFNKDIKEYTLKTTAEKLDFTTIKPTETEATYEIIGNENFTTGENIVTIRVTAPDKETTEDYVLKVTKEGSKNNNLASLEVVGYNLTPNFHKIVTFYAVEVSNDVNSIVIDAKAEDKNTTISGDGLHKIITGENYFNVEVTSEFGTKKVYTILVTKEASDNNNLASLNVSDGSLNPIFNKDTLDYEVIVPWDISNITINGSLEDQNAITNSFGNYNLEFGDNLIPIIVTSESGVVKTYNVKVTREEIVSAYLSNLEAKGYQLDPTFNKEIFEYYLNVDSEVTTFDLSYILEDQKANAVVTGNENFNVGMNEVKIQVTASDNVTINEYIIYVNRAMSTNNYLASLTTSEGSLNPIFNPKTLGYTIEVAREIETINISATTEDISAKITSGIGTHNLSIGNNEILIKVKSSIGITRTYKLNVIRKPSTNNFLKSLTVKDQNVSLELVPEFDKLINNYEIYASSIHDFVNIRAVLEDENATITGLGIKELKQGLNTFDIVVTAESGAINTYTLKITKEVSSNNYLSSLIPSSGTLSPEFNKDTDIYNLELEDVSSLSFDVTLESNKATVSGHEIKPVDEGASVRIITITAEDGTTRDYTINVTRPSKSEARLDTLEIAGYPFEFNPDTFTYNIQVSNSKKVLLESEITAIPKDENATVNMMGDLTIHEGMINIYVIEVIAKDGYTTQTYTLNITRDSEEYTLRSNKYEIVRFEDNTNEDYVIGINPSTIISDFKNNFENEPEDLKVYLETSEVADTELTATALILKLEKNGYVYDTLRVIVRGDLTKDGKVNITDQVKMINYVGRTTTFDKYQMLAADLTFDGNVNITDQVKIINYVGRTISDLNNKPTN